jgi:hypothetical protein
MKRAPTFNDLVLAARVRTLGLKEVEKVLMQKELNEFKKAVILRLAGNLLPRLNEHTGQDGQPLKITFDNALSSNSSSKTKGNCPVSKEI